MNPGKPKNEKEKLIFSFFFSFRTLFSILLANLLIKFDLRFAFEEEENLMVGRLSWTAIFFHNVTDGQRKKANSISFLIIRTLNQKENYNLWTLPLAVSLCSVGLSPPKAKKKEKLKEERKPRKSWNSITFLFYLQTLSFV